MRFFSDNAAPAHPKVMEAIAAANRIDTAYDGDEWSSRLDGAFSELFGAEVRAFWVTTGTAAIASITLGCAGAALSEKNLIRRG
jgi:threonine aldolase